MKKILSVLLPCLLLLGLFVGCQSGVPVPSAPAETPAATEAPATEAPAPTEAPMLKPIAPKPPLEINVRGCSNLSICAAHI